MSGTGDNNGNGGFLEYRRLILSSLKNLDEKVGAMDEKIDTIVTEVALLKLKSGLWGAVAGAIPAVVVLIIIVIRGQLG